MNKTTFIYALICPDTGEVRYIGKADNPRQRYQGHLANREKTATHKNDWIKSLLAKGQKPGLLIVEEVDEGSWQEAEIRWIAHYRLSGGNLTNISDGGSGASSRQKDPSMNTDQMTLKIWGDTYKTILEIKDQTHEPITHIIHRLIITEIDKLKGKGEGITP